MLGAVVVCAIAEEGEAANEAAAEMRSAAAMALTGRENTGRLLVCWI
jgi:hypothetical protein